MMSASSDRLILVTGASGRTARRCIGKLTELGAGVRALVRRDSAAAELRALGAFQTEVGDLLDRSLLRRATQGVSSILHICPPMHPQETELAEWITDLAIENGVERLVLYSVLHPTIDVPHHRRKLAAETYVINSGCRYTILQPCRYMQHLLPIWREIIAEGVHRMPFSVEARFSLVDMDDLASAAATVLLEPGHDFATYQLAGPEALSQIDCARIISDVLGKQVRAQQKPLDAFLAQARNAGIPEQRLDVMTVMNRHYDAHGLVGNPNVLQWLLGRSPKTLRQFVEGLASAPKS
jgi:uncharacterized protein YbjT (DUF2867 family)